MIPDVGQAQSYVATRCSSPHYSVSNDAELVQYCHGDILIRLLPMGARKRKWVWLSCRFADQDRKTDFLTHFEMDNVPPPNCIDACSYEHFQAGILLFSIF